MAASKRKVNQREPLENIVLQKQVERLQRALKSAIKNGASSSLSSKSSFGTRPDGESGRVGPATVHELAHEIAQLTEQNRALLRKVGELQAFMGEDAPSQQMEDISCEEELAGNGLWEEGRESGDEVAGLYIRALEQDWAPEIKEGFRCVWGSTRLTYKTLCVSHCIGTFVCAHAYASASLCGQIDMILFVSHLRMSVCVHFLISACACAPLAAMIERNGRTMHQHEAHLRDDPPL